MTARKSPFKPIIRLQISRLHHVQKKFFSIKLSGLIHGKNKIILTAPIDEIASVRIIKKRYQNSPLKKREIKSFPALSKLQAISIQQGVVIALDTLFVINIKKVCFWIVFSLKFKNFTYPSDFTSRQSKKSLTAKWNFMRKYFGCHGTLMAVVCMANMIWCCDNQFESKTVGKNFNCAIISLNELIRAESQLSKSCRIKSEMFSLWCAEKSCRWQIY